MSIEGELAALTAAAVGCRSCGHGYPEHEAGGGHCGGRIGGCASPANAIPCPCPGFRWIDPAGPSVGSYTDAPQR